MPQIALELPANEGAAARARAALRDVAGSLGPDDRWRAELIVTELVTNAVVHGPGGPVELALESGGDGVRGQVADAGGGIAAVEPGREADEGGRGLDLVRKLADGFGVARGESRVWFEVVARA